MQKFYSTLVTVATLAIVMFTNVCFSQTLELGILSSFEAYTGAGAITNSGEVTGDAGSNIGIISGSGFGVDYTGTIYENDSVTAQAKIDLLRVYIHLSDVFVTFPGTHAPDFGGGETITPGVYSIPGAGSIGGTITLDAGGNPDAFFIMKFEGAFTIGVGTEIILAGGTRAANVYWIAEGAISVGSDSVLGGTLLSHPGAVSLGTGCTIDGRILATEGALTIGAGSVAVVPEGDSTIPIKCLGLCSPNPAVDVLESISKYALFTSAGAVSNAASSGIVGDIGTNLGAVSGFGTSTQVGSTFSEDSVTAQAAIDLDFAYNQLVILENTELGHLPAFGSGEIVFPGVYYIGGAGSLAGTITLDAQEDENAIFVFKFNGAFATAAQSKVILINGARHCNVFWIAEGAASMGTFTFMKGTVLAHGGACTMGANGNLEGRMLSTAGAIGFSTGVIYNDTLCFGDDTPSSGGDQDVCSDGTANQTITATATSNSNVGIIIWYDAPTGGNLVEVPSQVGIGSVTYYAESFNGSYSSETRVAVSLIIRDCSVIIDAVADITTTVNGLIGGVTAALTLNDTLDEDPVVIGTNPGEVALTAISVPMPLSLNADGTVTIPPNTPTGDYIVEYEICEIDYLSNCDSTTATIVVLSQCFEPQIVGDEPADAEYSCSESLPAVPTVEFSDVLDDDLVITFSQTIEDLDCGEAVTRTWTATNFCGNSITVNQVLSSYDRSAPILIGIPEDTTLECDQAIPDAIVFAIDNCDYDLTVALTAVTTPLDCGYQFIRTWTTADECGNEASASQVITVEDT
ncbi:MAG: hypothetical protein ACJAQ5_002222, partial [Flavobacteriales bacterium]